MSKEFMYDVFKNGVKILENASRKEVVKVVPESNANNLYYWSFNNIDIVRGNDVFKLYSHRIKNEKWEEDFSKEWDSICKELKNSDRDLSAIPIVCCDGRRGVFK